jgi:hypothetical protein
LGVATHVPVEDGISALVEWRYPTADTGRNFWNTGAVVGLTSKRWVKGVGRVCSYTMSNHDDATDHLEDLEDGSGCTEIWEHLSERREAEADD